MNKKNGSLSIYAFLFFAVVLIAGIIYVVWRWMFTLNLLTSPFTTFWSFTLLLAEILTLIVFTNFSIILLALDNLDDNKIENKLQNDYYKDVYYKGELVTFKNFCPSVDIFICTYNEEADLLSTTISACKNIDYPNKHVYVLDDGRRREIKELTEILGCNYITRENNKGFKAGNINNALKKTGSELIVIFDADHIPTSTFLRETVYNFTDEKLALVQTPQYFCNLDAFQKNLNMPSFLANEQDTFYKIVEPSLNEFGTTFCGGTNIVIRRKHLEAIGNFPETTITEDSLVGLMFHANGYHVHYYNRALAIGLAASNFDEYIKQRCRWAKGNLQIFLNPQNWKLYKQLKPIQAFFYLSSALYFLTPIARLIFLLAPILFLFFDISPLLVLFYQVFIFQISYFILKFAFIFTKKINPGNIILADVYDLITSIFTIGSILSTVFIPKIFSKIKFTVTSKNLNIQSKNLKYKVVLLLIIALLITAEAQGIHDLLFEEVYSKLAIVANLFWNSVNIFVLLLAIRVVFDKPEKREYQRVKIKEKIILKDCKGNKYEGIVEDASRSGISFEMSQKLKNNSDECEIKADLDELEIPVNILSAQKKFKIYLYKSMFKKPLSLYRLSRKMVNKIDKYVRFAYKTPNFWNKKDE